jgi:hypothetical protein
MLSAMQSSIGDKTGLPDSCRDYDQRFVLNWYRFPGVYTASYISTEIVGFILVRVIAALVLQRGTPQSGKLSFSA